MQNTFSSGKLKIADQDQVRHVKGLCEKPDADGNVKPCQYCNRQTSNLSADDVDEIMNNGTLGGAK